MKLSILSLLATFTVITTVLPCFAQPERRIVPRHDWAIELPELGRMTGAPGDCNFGEKIIPIGDCNNDSLADWLVLRRRCDTTFIGRPPNDFLLYKGVRGGLPSHEDRVRIGPEEIGVELRFIAAGDWDGDSYGDLAIKITPMVKDSITNPTGYGVGTFVIWWGNERGEYSLEDTTHIAVEAEGWLGPQQGWSWDIDRDGIDDLLIDGVSGFLQGEIDRSMPPTQIYFGARGKRWGREIDALWDWGWWNMVPGRLEIIDQDADGLDDLVFYDNTHTSGQIGGIRIIYGIEEQIIDTASVVEVRYDSAGGKVSRLMDITGDGVRELVLNTGEQERLKVFIGFKGQRIDEQYGSGNEPAHPGEATWWGKPWASVPLPGLLHDGWASSGRSSLFDLGDADLDGIDDIWVASWPEIIAYRGVYFLDSLYECWISNASTSGPAIALGDIDGTGKSTIAMQFDGAPLGVRFLQNSDSVPRTGRYRALPPGTEPRSTSVPASRDLVTGQITVSAHPNPGTDVIHVTWTMPDDDRQGSEITLQITDMVGQEVLTTRLPSSSRAFSWNASKAFAGAYSVQVSTDSDRGSTAIIIRK